MSVLERASELAEETPEHRNRYVDFLRVAALGLVIAGHWLVMDVRLESGIPTGTNVLTELEWAHWVTWLFQVIPIFFLIGGYANSASWRRHIAGDGDWPSWLNRRALRLLWPTAIFVVAGSLTAPIVAAATEVPRPTLDRATWAIGFILWFLAVYIVVASLTPLSLRAHDRWGLGFVGFLILGVIAGDIAMFATGLDAWAYANYALVWGAFHQLGFAWRDGDLETNWKVLAGGATCLVIVLALVLAGPYPVSMVGVPGSEIRNTGPPNLALLFFGLTQIGLVLSLRRPAGRLLHRARVWVSVVTGNLVVMSAFLWHVVPVVILSILLWMTGIDLPGPIGSSRWLAFRVVWILMLTALLVPIVFVVGRFERPPDVLDEAALPYGGTGVALAFGLTGLIAVSAGLARLALVGFWVAGASTPPLWGLAGLFGGSVLILLGGALARGPEQRSQGA